MKKISLIAILALVLFGMASCQKSTTTTTTTTAPLSIPEIVSALDNPYNVALFLTESKSSLGINFELPSETEGYVEYRLVNSGGEFQRVIATNKTSQIGSKTVYLYEATMTGLNSASTYEYRVGNTVGDYVSDTFTTTMNNFEDGTFTFMYLADPQENTEFGYMAYAYGILNVLQTSEAAFDFALYPGDLVNDADVRSEWNWFFQYSSFFLTSKPMIATIGNHESFNITDDRINHLEFDAYLNLPNNGPIYDTFDELENDARNTHFDDGKTYSFNYENTHFLFIDTEVFCDGTTLCGSYDVSNGEILKTWIENDLSNNDMTWTVVVLHRGPYSLSYDTHSVRENLVPIFEQYGVDLVLSGHDHQYSRAVYQNSVMTPFQTSSEIAYGEISLFPEISGDLNFNHYSSSVGVTYFSSNTASTKFYAGDKSSGIDVQYRFLDEMPVIPFITITNDSIHVVSYVVLKDSAFAIVPTGVEILEEFTITK